MLSGTTVNLFTSRSSVVSVATDVSDFGNVSSLTLQFFIVNVFTCGRCPNSSGIAERGGLS